MWYILYDGDYHAGPFETASEANHAFAQIKDPELYTISDDYQEYGPGFYISIDATILSGPYATEEEAYFWLTPEKRQEWTFELGGPRGKEWFMQLPLEAFSVYYSKHGGWA